MPDDHLPRALPVAANSQHARSVAEDVHQIVHLCFCRISLERLFDIGDEDARVFWDCLGNDLSDVVDAYGVRHGLTEEEEEAAHAAVVSILIRHAEDFNAVALAGQALRERILADLETL